MKRKPSKGDSRDLRVLRKLAHERAAQIGAPDRPPIDLEEILGVPITTVGPDRVDAEDPPEPAPAHHDGVRVAAADPVAVEARGSQPGTARRCDLVRLSGEGARHLRMLTELQLSTFQMLAAPFLSWSRMQREAANWYLLAVGHAIYGTPKGCSAGRYRKSAL
jgi:hypothetical protein